MIRLQPIPFVLPNQAGLANIDSFSQLRNKINEIGYGSGKSSDWFQQRCQEFERIRDEGDGILEMLQSRRDIRVILHLWLTSDDWRFDCPPTQEVLDTIMSYGELRPSHVYDLIQLYLKYFDELPDLLRVTEILRYSLANIPETRWFENMQKLRSNAQLIFSEDAPKEVAARITKFEHHFAQGMEQIGVSTNQGGRFLKVCEQTYFIEVIRQLEPGGDHHIFNELVKPDVKETPYDRRLNIGQAVCAVMIEKCIKYPKRMPETWLEIVLKVVGDPRRPTNSSSYQKWWAGMKIEHEKYMRRWLAGLDLHLFLKILKDCSTDEALERMYPARQAFLEGLLDHYEVEDARLFLGREAANFIRRKYGRESLLAHGLLSDRNKSVIYIRVAGHDFFEGTHSYAARLGVSLPPKHPIITRRKNSFNMGEVTTALDNDAYFYVRHWPPLGWQKNLIDGFHQLGLPIKPEHVLTPTDYLEYRRKYGV